jgi:hypothetical protein
MRLKYFHKGAVQIVFILQKKGHYSIDVYILNYNVNNKIIL